MHLEMNFTIAVQEQLLRFVFCLLLSIANRAVDTTGEVDEVK